MQSPPVSDSASPRSFSFRAVWSLADELALLTPILAIVWMTLISVMNHQRLHVFSPEFRMFGLWEFVAVAGTAWLAGLLARLMRRRGEDQTVRRRFLGFLAFVVMLGLGYVLVCKVSQMIVLSGFTLCAGLLFYLGLNLMDRRPTDSPQPAQNPDPKARAGKFSLQQPMTIMSSTFFAAAAWMALRYEGQEMPGILCRGWLALAFFAPAWLSMRADQPERPVAGLTRDLLGAYVFAVGASLAPMAWGGEPQLLFAADSTLLVTLVVGVNIWLARDLEGGEGPERDFMAKFIPLSILAGFAASGLLWQDGDANNRLLAASAGLSLLLISLIHFASRKVTSGRAKPLCFASLLSPVVVLAARHWFPGVLS